MSMFPTSMECLALELEAYKASNDSLVLENECLRNRVSELLSEKRMILSDKSEKFMAEIETEVLVKIAHKLAPVMGMTKDKNFDVAVRRALEKKRK